EKAATTVSVTGLVDSLLAERSPPVTYARWDNVISLIDHDSQPRSMPLPGTALSAVNTTGLPAPAGNRVLTKASPSTIASSEQVDPRYASIVVIQTPRGTL